MSTSTHIYTYTYRACDCKCIRSWYIELPSIISFFCVDKDLDFDFDIDSLKIVDDRCGHQFASPIPHLIGELTTKKQRQLLLGLARSQEREKIKPQAQLN